MMGPAGSSIAKRVSLVICTIDDFTGEIISGSSIRVYSCHQKAIRKDDGYYVFINLCGDMHEITVESDIYFTEKLAVSLNEIDPLNPVYYVRLIPNPLYPVQYGTTVIRGMVHNGLEMLEGVVVKTIPVSAAQSVKIAEDSAEEGSAMIRLYMARETPLFGKEFYIQGRSGSNGEFCRIIRQCEDGRYILKDKLKSSYSRGTPLLGFSKTYTNMKGEFFLLLHVEKELKAVLNIEFIFKDKVFQKEFEINSNEANHVGRINILE